MKPGIYFRGTSGGGGGSDGSAQGVFDIPNGADTVAVVFDTPFSVAPTSVVCNVSKPTAGVANIFGVPVLASVTTTGFTAELTDNVPTTGWKLAWRAK